jgi:hypothetical protein|tara:strand:+ start:264 stop:461 length:198 start_codon:yes stop_codon:yes gene_type:complete
MTDTNEINFDPVVECSWLPDREVRLSEYNQMITHYVQKYIAEKLDAKQLRPEEFSNGPQQTPEGL